MHDDTEKPHVSTLPDETAGMAENEVGRSVMRDLINSDGAPAPIAYSYIGHITEDFAQKNRLGHGAFGEVYRGKDVTLNVSFAVKRIRCDICREAREENLREVKKQFQREIEILTYFRHPNVARLYAHCIHEDVGGQHCLVFKLASRGSLDKFFENDIARKRLPWYRRIHIALDVSKALCYLHNGGGGFKCYHRDLKSANICLTGNYTAKLVDCGLSKLITDEGSQSKMTLSKCTTGAAVIGTRGYICPKYSRTAKFTSNSEVFAFGIVLAELATGTLQNHEVDGDEVDFFDRYIDDDEPALLINDFDNCAGSWAPSAIDEFGALSLECMARRTSDRPTIKAIVSRLRFMAREYCELSPSEIARVHYDKVLEQNIVTCSPSSWKEGTCQLCYFDSVPGLTCSSVAPNHFICNKCFEEHVLVHASEVEVRCPISSCSSPSFPDNVVVSHVAKETLVIVHAAKTRRDMATAVELMSQNLSAVNASNMEVLDSLHKIQRGMLSLASGRCRCPSLFIVVPQSSPANVATNPSSWFTSAFQETYYLYFLCGYDLTPIESRIEVKMTKEWVRKIAPVVKVALVALQLSMKVMLAYSPDLLSCVPCEGSNDVKLGALQEAINPFIQEEGRQWRANVGDIADREDFREYREDAYPLIEMLAMDQTGWRKEMVQMTTGDGILWVKKQNEHMFGTAPPKQMPQAIPSAVPLPESGVPPDESRLCSWRLRNPRRRKMCLLLMIGVIVIAVGAILGVLLSKNREGDAMSSPTETSIQRPTEDAVGPSQGGTTIQDYPDCDVNFPGGIGNGICSGGEYNTEECGWDGGDCTEFNELYPNCRVEFPRLVGNGYCSGGEYNTEECGYDGGDCCKESCKPGWYGNCEGPWDKCVDPKYSG